MGRSPLGVLAVVVIAARKGSDLDDGEGFLLFLIAPDSHRQLTASDEFLHQYLIIVLESLHQSVFKFFMAFHDIDADAGPLGRGLDHHGQGELSLNLRSETPFHFIAIVSAGTRRRNPLSQKYTLGSGLVHGDSRSQHSGTCVRNAQHIKGALQQPILAELAVEGVENNGAVHFLDVVGKGLGHQFHAFSIVTLGLQCIQNGCAGAPGNLGLRGGAAHHYYYLILIHFYGSLTSSAFLPALHRSCKYLRHPW